MPVGWAGALTNDRAAANGGWLAGTSWSYADRVRPFQRVAGLLDPNNPQVVAFDVDLTGVSWDKPGWLLLAVVLADDDPLDVNAGTDVAHLVRTDRHVAARSVRRARVLAEPMSSYAGMDTGEYPG